MGDIYLTSELKAKYMEDFETNVLNCCDEFWDLDDGLTETLSQINSNQNIQTLYSKKLVAPESGAWSSQTDSYLKFAFSEEVELEILREVIPNCFEKFTSSIEESYCIYQYCFPTVNSNYSIDDSKSIKLGCVDDEDYFKINHIRIELNSHNQSIHEEFWEYLKSNLSRL